MTMFDGARLWIYHKLSYQLTHFPYYRFFRFGIPLVIKQSHFSESSETDALRFLRKMDLNLPIPRVLDSVTVDGQVYTITTRLPGNTMLNLSQRKEMKFNADVEKAAEAGWELIQDRI
jgi:hypothetical protein